MAQFEGQFTVGDRVQALCDDYECHQGKDLVVLYMDGDPGYGVGVVGNDPTLDHCKDGWLWYHPDEVGPVD